MTARKTIGARETNERHPRHRAEDEDRLHDRPGHLVRARLRALLERGMNVARLNFAHGEPAEHGAVLAGIRALSEELDVPTAVLQDLAGPKVRIGALAHGRVELETGCRFTLTTRPLEGSRDRVSVSWARLPAEVGVGDTLLLADGVIHLRVEGAPETGRRLALVRGVLSLPLPASSQDPEEMIEVARRAARDRGWLGMRAVFVSHDRLWTGRL